MPLTAIVGATQKRIVIADDLEVAKQYRDDLICPICDAAVIPVRDHFRGGQAVSAYARHRDTRDHHETQYRYHPESPHHLAAKKYLAENAAALLPLPAEIKSFSYEVRLERVMRIADVCLVLANNDVMVLEAQLATTTPEEIAERTNDYQSLGYAVCWFLGKDANKDYNIRACYDGTGFCGFLDFREEAENYRPARARAAA